MAESADGSRDRDLSDKEVRVRSLPNSVTDAPEMTTNEEPGHSHSLPLAPKKSPSSKSIHSIPPLPARQLVELSRSRASLVHGQESEFHKLLRRLAEEHDQELARLKKALHASHLEKLKMEHEKKRRSARGSGHFNTAESTGVSEHGSVKAVKSTKSKRGSGNWLQSSSADSRSSAGGLLGRMAKGLATGGGFFGKTLSQRLSTKKKSVKDDFHSPGIPEGGKTNATGDDFGEANTEPTLSAKNSKKAASASGTIIKAKGSVSVSEEARAFRGGLKRQQTAAVKASEELDDSDSDETDEEEEGDASKRHEQDDAVVAISDGQSAKKDVQHRKKHSIGSEATIASRDTNGVLVSEVAPSASSCGEAPVAVNCDKDSTCSAENFALAHSIDSIEKVEFEPASGDKVNAETTADRSSEDFFKDVLKADAVEANGVGSACRGYSINGSSIVIARGGPTEDPSGYQIMVPGQNQEGKHSESSTKSIDRIPGGSSDRDTSHPPWSMFASGSLGSNQAENEGDRGERPKIGVNGARTSLVGSSKRESISGSGMFKMSSIDERIAGVDDSSRTNNIRASTMSTNSLLLPTSRREGGGSILKMNSAASAPAGSGNRLTISFDEAVTTYNRVSVQFASGESQGEVETTDIDESSLVQLRFHDSEDDEHKVVFAPHELWNPPEEEERQLSERLSQDSRKKPPPKIRSSRIRDLLDGGGASERVQHHLLTTGSAYTEEELTRKWIQEQTLLRRIFGPPGSPFNFYVDLLSIFVICIDIVVIPLTVFDPGESIFTDVLSYLTTLFWTGDLIRNFFVGYFKKGDVVMDMKAIVWNYLTTWFLLDFSIVLLDWTMFFFKLANGEDQHTSAPHVFRALRNVRTLRLLRSMKANHLLKLIQDRINSEVVGVAFGLGKLFAIILVVNHLTACGWYWIGKTNVGKRPNWLEVFFAPPGSKLAEPGEFNLGEIALEYRYFTSFHWACTHLVSSPLGVEPQNSYERLFAIVVVFNALVTVSSFVGGLTSAVMHLGSMSSAKSKQFWLLKRYLRELGVSAQLSVRIQNYCDYVWSLQEQRVQESTVQVLSLLSTSLQSELKTAIYEPRLSSHPFFVLIGKVAPMTIRFLCSTALCRISLGRGDCLFSTHQMATQMWFVCGGQLMYYMAEEDPEEVEEDMWLCEPVLWVTEWATRGTVQVTRECEIVAVDSEKFGPCLHANLHARSEALVYSKGFVQNLNRMMNSRLTDLYRTPLIEGLWFRLINEHEHHKPSMMRSGTQRRDGLIGFRPDMVKAWSIGKKR